MTKKENIKIKKYKDGSISELVGDKNIKYTRPVRLPFRFVTEHLSFIQSTTNEGGRVPLFHSKKEIEEREPIYDPNHSERINGTGSIEKYNSYISIFGSGYETSVLNIDIVKFPSSEKHLSGGSIVFFLGEETEFCVTLYIESLVFDDIKSLLLNNCLKSLSVGLDFSRNKRVYSDSTFDRQWRIIESDETEPFIEGPLQSITFESRGYKTGEQNT